jgi:hypothetical protein
LLSRATSFALWAIWPPFVGGLPAYPTPAAAASQRRPATFDRSPQPGARPTRGFTISTMRPAMTSRPRRLPLALGLGGTVLIAASLLAGEAVAHTGAPISAPVDDLSAGGALVEFSKYGFKHILLGYDHLLFLAGLALLSTGARDVAAIVGIFALSYSATLVGGTLLEIAVPGDLIDAVIAVSVGYVGAQIAFGTSGGWLSRNPRGPALAFGLAHGLGLSSLLQELRLPGDDLLPSVLGFNLGVELGQIVAIAVFIAALLALHAFPFPARERIPAGSGFISVASALLAFVILGVNL